MVVMHIHAEILPGKNLELKQTALSLLPHLMQEKGCLGYVIYQSINDRSKMCFLSEWKTKNDLKGHFLSRMFAITSGAIHSLCENVYFKISSKHFAGTFNELKADPSLLTDK